MPNVKSAKKRVKQSEKRRLINKGYKTRIKNAIRKLNDSIAANSERDEIMNNLSNVFKAIDKGHSKGVVHKNKAARKKSRLHKKVKEFLNEYPNE